MHYRYERICIEAGCDEEVTRSIGRYLDAEKKRLKRQRISRDEKGIVFNRMSRFVDEDGEPIPLPDLTTDLEEDIFHFEELLALRKALDELPKDDRAFLLRIYGGERGELSNMAREMGVPRSTLDSRKNKLLTQLRQKLKKEI